MKVVIKKTPEEAACFVAKHISNLVNNKPDMVLGLPTGGTPLLTYSELIKKHALGEVSFKGVTTFNMDEYVGLEPYDEHSYRYFMDNEFFNHIDIKKENTHVLDGLSEDVNKECALFESKINTAGGIDLFLGGVGVDGHIAFNEPFSPLNSRTRCVKLTELTRIQNARFFNNDINQVPTHALTVGIQTILDAKEVIIIATGEAKSNAVSDAVDGYITHKSAVTALQNHSNTTIVCDEAAACLLSKQAKEYFCAA